MSVKRHVLIAVTTVATLSAPLTSVLAQVTPAPRPRDASTGNDHKLRHTFMGAAIGGLLSVGYYFLSERGERSGNCGPWDCAMPYLTVSGGISGLFMSYQLAAQKRSEAPRVGDALTFSSADYAMPAAPMSLGLRDSLLAIATDSGAQVMSTASRAVALRRRGAGLSDVRLVALTGGSPRLLIGTGTALWETGTTSGLLSRVLDGPVDALSAFGNTVVSASGKTVRVRRGEGASLKIDTLIAPDAVTSAAHDEQTGNWWLTTDTLLIELKVGEGAPSMSTRASISGQGRAVATSAEYIAVALGSNGIAVWPRQALAGSGVTTPVTLKGEPRFAFDLAFLDGDIYVAGGVDGVTRISLAPSAHILGSSRQAGYATNIVSDGTALWVADRTPGRTRVIRVTP